MEKKKEMNAGGFMGITPPTIHRMVPWLIEAKEGTIELVYLGRLNFHTFALIGVVKISKHHQ